MAVLDSKKWSKPYIFWIIKYSQRLIVLTFVRTQLRKVSIKYLFLDLDRLTWQALFLARVSAVLGMSWLGFVNLFSRRSQDPHPSENRPPLTKMKKVHFGGKGDQARLHYSSVWWQNYWTKKQLTACELSQWIRHVVRLAFHQTQLSCLWSHMIDWSTRKFFSNLHRERHL